MPDDAPSKTSNALIHIDAAAAGEAAKLLIEKVSDAIGGLASPWQIRRVAKAEADAKIIQADAEIEISDRQKRAMRRWIAEEDDKQANMESITAKALPHVKPDAQPGKIERDWLTNFFDKSRLTSDAEMQELWAKILAGEANAPGRFSKQTVGIVAQLEKGDAHLFQTLCRFNWWHKGEPYPVIGRINSEIFARFGVDWHSLIHLSEVGLVFLDWNQGAWLTTVASEENPNVQVPLEMEYHGVVLSLLPLVANGLRLGTVKFSRAGRELARICGPGEPIPGYVDFTAQFWEKEMARLVGRRVRE